MSTQECHNLASVLVKACLTGSRRPGTGAAHSLNADDAAPDRLRYRGGAVMYA
jgi:hypothetical protein